MDKKYTMRYASLQAAYWLGAVATLNFAESFLLTRGFDEAGVGVLLAIGFLFALVLEPLTASLADREDGISLRIQLIAGFALTALFSLGLLLLHGRWITAVLFVAAATVMLVLLPLINAVSFSYINRGIQADFSFGRGIGSAAFVLSSYLGGRVIQKIPDFSMGILLVGGILGFLFAILFAPSGKGSSQKKEKGGEVLRVLQNHPELLPLLAANICLMACHNYLNTYFLNLIEPTGAGVETVGVLGAIGAIMELPILLGFNWIAKRVKLQVMMVVASVMFVVKACVSALPTLLGMGIWTMYFSMVLQMFAFALFLPASSVFVNLQVEAKDQAKGQMLLTETQVMGTVLCTLFGGMGITHIGTAMTTLAFALVGVVGILFVLITVSKKNNQSV